MRRAGGDRMPDLSTQNRRRPVGTRCHRVRYPRRAFVLRRLRRCIPLGSRDERIMELENALDEEGVADADLAIIRVQLDLLRLGDASEKDERKSWQTIKARAGAVFMNERVQILVFSLANTAVRHELGLPPA